MILKNLKPNCTTQILPLNTEPPHGMASSRVFFAPIGLREIPGILSRRKKHLKMRFLGKEESRDGGAKQIQTAEYRVCARGKNAVHNFFCYEMLFLNFSMVQISPPAPPARTR